MVDQEESVVKLDAFDDEAYKAVLAMTGGRAFCAFVMREGRKYHLKSLYSEVICD